jgi:single-strand DNA-binding protein
MANFNKVLLMGNLTRDPEIRYPTGGGGSGGGGGGGREGGSAICKFGLAVNRVWRNQAGEKQEETCFVDIVVFGRTAENCNEYLRKGRPAFVEGRLHYDSWEDRETGKKRNKLEVVAENVQFLGSRDGSGGGAPPSGAGSRREDSGAHVTGRDEVPSGEPPAAATRGGKSASGGEEINFDDIPF